jgi:multiple sugar transport system permease protein
VHRRPTRGALLGRWKRSLADRIARQLFLAPVSIFLTLFVLLPFVYSVWQSLLSYDFQNPSVFGHFTGVKNYRILLSNSIFFQSLVNTAEFTAASIVIEFPLGFVIAMYLQRLRWRERQFLLSLLIVPMVLAPVAVGLLWKFLINPQYGVLSYYFGRMGFTFEPLLSNPHFALWAVRAVDMWQWTPFTVLIFQASLSSVPIEFLEAAEIDRLSPLLRLRYVILPWVVPTVAVALLIRLLESFKVFDMVFILTGGGPGNATEMVTLYANRIAFIDGNFGLASADVLVLNCIVLAGCKLLLVLATRLQKSANIGFQPDQGV